MRFERVDRQGQCNDYGGEDLPSMFGMNWLPEILDAGCGLRDPFTVSCRAFPRCRVLAVSNSRLQRKFIEDRCREMFAVFRLAYAGWQGLSYLRHRTFAYLFASENEDDWMGQYFFTAGMMPSDDPLRIVGVQGRSRMVDRPLPLWSAVIVFPSIFSAR